MMMFRLTAVFCIVYTKLLRIDAETVDLSSQQLLKFRELHPQPVGILTTSSGAPVGWSELNTLNSDLLQNNFFMDIMNSFVSERIPERLSHGEGTGAFGYFEVTNDITRYCKAKLFEKVGKKTPVVVRLSPAIRFKGNSDTGMESRGYAVKFYTEEGNFDIVGLNQPVFNIYDPVYFPSLTHSQKPNPATNVIDQTSYWDFVVRRPESLFDAIILKTGRGTPDGYRHMPGYGIHTYQVVNKRNETYFMRFHFLPDAGIKNLNVSEAKRLVGADPKYATKDLYNAISSGNFPSWSVKIQILSVSDAIKAKVNPFDVTKLLPERDYPLQPLGRIVLNRNPNNFFADIEQLALCPSNLVPGIVGAPDKIFMARGIAYRNAHSHRLGGNSNKIPVNCPYRTKVFTYNRDGEPPVGDNENDIPNYIPNSFSGPIPTVIKPKLLYLRNDFTSNIDQIAEYYKELPTYEKNSLGEVIGDNMCSVPKSLQDKVIALVAKVSPQLSRKVIETIKYC